MRSGFVTGVVLTHLVALIFAAGTMTGSLAADADPVIAIVNQEPIHHSQLKPLIDDFKKQAKKNALTTSEKEQLVKNLIRRKLILQQDFADQLRKNPEISQRVQDYEDKLVLEGYIKQHVGDFLTVSAEETKQYYLQNLHQFAAPPKVRASHILLRTMPEAKQVLVKLKAGEDFSELAKQHSIDLPMALSGGSMGTITKGRSLPQLEEVLFILKVGQYSDIVQTQFGCHILRVDEIINDPYVPYEKVKDRIKVILIREKEARAYGDMTQQLEKNADITIYENRL